MLRRILLMLAMVVFAHTTLAETSNKTYTIQIPVEGNSEDSRQMAIEKALHQVIARLIEENVLQTNVVLDTLYVNASQYVESYTYVTESDSSNDQSASKILNVHFDATAINQFLKQEGMLHDYKFTLQVLNIISEPVFRHMINTLQSLDNTESVVVTKVVGNVVTLNITSLQDQSAWLESVKATPYIFSTQ